MKLLLLNEIVNGISSIVNGKLCNVVEDITGFRGCVVESAHFLLISKLVFLVGEGRCDL